MNVAVLGSSRPREGEPDYETARELGREIARRHATVLCGGYGGVMEAACRGAAEAGGESIGVVLVGRGEPNRWVSRALSEPDLAARLTRLRDLGDAWIFLPRGLGTMLELVWIAESVVKELVAPRSLVLLGDYWRPTLEIALAEASSAAGARSLERCIRAADSPARAADAALAGAGGDPGRVRPMSARVGRRFCGLVLLAALIAAPAKAWLYEEHREISARGIGTLDPERRAALARLWGEAREGVAARLCAAPSAGAQGDKPDCIDLAAWPAISADHSCSPHEMLDTVLESDWILGVAAASARTQRKIEKARNEAERRNAQANGDLALESTDREYSTRAGANNAHFLLPRSGIGDPVQYALAALRPGSEINAAAIYALYHVAALHQAALLGDGGPQGDSSAGSARQVLALEAFALHFLEDSFAAGHIAGSWGNVAERKGTHDYYNDHGLDVENWRHEEMLIFGDGHMRPGDLERAGRAVAASLAEVLDAFRPGSAESRDARAVTVPAEVEAGEFDVCKSDRMPEWAVPPAMVSRLGNLMRMMPVPFQGPGYGSLPRFRAEIGSFMGLESGVAGAGSGGGFTKGRSGGVQGVLDVGLRFGLGLEALLGDSGDGLVFVQGGLVSQTRSTAGCEGGNCPSDPLLQQFAPVVPARTGWNFRLRVPFWLIPGDLLLATPLLAFTSPNALKKMAIRSADGGLIPWQTKIFTPIGRVQFVIGREVSATLFGYGEKDAFLAVVERPEGASVVPIGVKTIQWEFPLLEYRPFREYGTRYSYATFLQLGAGFDRPVKAVVIGRPDLAPPPLQTRVFGFVRIFFDGRRYF